MRKLLLTLLSIWIVPALAMEQSQEELDKQLLKVAAKFYTTANDMEKNDPDLRSFIEVTKNQMQALLAAGANPNYTEPREDAWPRTPLMFVIRSKELCSLLIHNNADIHQEITDNNDEFEIKLDAPLLALLAPSIIDDDEDKAVAQLFLDTGADVNKSYNKLGLTALTYCISEIVSDWSKSDAYKQHLLKSIKFLLKNGANANVWNYCNFGIEGSITSVPRPLLIDIMTGYAQKDKQIRPSIVQALLDAGADVQARTSLGHTPLIAAAKVIHLDDSKTNNFFSGLDCCKLFLAHQKKLNACTFTTLLCIAQLAKENHHFAPLYRNFKHFFAPHLGYHSIKEMLSACDNEGKNAYYYLLHYRNGYQIPENKLDNDIRNFNPENYK